MLSPEECDFYAMEIYSTPFVVKPEGVSNVFVMYF